MNGMPFSILKGALLAENPFAAAYMRVTFPTPFSSTRNESSQEDKTPPFLMYKNITNLNINVKRFVNFYTKKLLLLDDERQAV